MNQQEGQTVSGNEPHPKGGKVRAPLVGGNRLPQFLIVCLPFCTRYPVRTVRGACSALPFAGCSHGQ